MEVREAAYGPMATVALHAHEAQILAIPQGSTFELTISRRRIVCRRGIAVTRPGEPHHNRFGPRGARLILIETPGEIEMPALVEDSRAQALAARLSLELRASDTAAPLAREGLALELVALAARARVQETSLDRLDRFLDAHFLEPLRLRDLASVVNLHPAHVARVFRQRRGESLAAHLRRRRIEWAKERLLRTREPIASIALEAGFCDQGHFCRVFRRFLGITPGSLRPRR